MKKEPILSVKDLGISFSQYTKGLRRRELEVITNLDIDLYEGEILAVVGSSGSGKSLLAHAILGILPDNATTEGNIIYKGKTLTLKDKEKLRGREILKQITNLTLLKTKRKRNSIYTSISKFFRPINEGIKASKNINRE